MHFLLKCVSSDKIEEIGTVPTCYRWVSTILQNQLVLVHCKTTQRGIWQWMRHYPSQEARALLTPQGIYSKFLDFGQIFLFFFLRVFYIFVVVFAFFPTYSSLFVYGTVLNSVVDPELYSQDPDPTFQVVPDATL